MTETVRFPHTIQDQIGDNRWMTDTEYCDAGHNLVKADQDQEVERGDQAIGTEERDQNRDQEEAAREEQGRDHGVKKVETIVMSFIDQGVPEEIIEVEIDGPGMSQGRCHEIGGRKRSESYGQDRDMIVVEERVTNEIEGKGIWMKE